MKRRTGIISAVLLAVFMAFLSGCDLGPTKGAFLTVSHSRCTGCGECVKVCDADAIVIINNKAVIDVAKCVECGQCIDACPYDAIQ